MLSGSSPAYANNHASFKTEYQNIGLNKSFQMEILTNISLKKNQNYGKCTQEDTNNLHKIQRKDTRFSFP